MVKRPAKADFPVSNVRRYLEPGPIVLVSSRWRGQDNVMTLGWHTLLEFTPALIGLMIAGGNHSFDMVRDSGACIGNTSGAAVDKFARFGLTAGQGAVVDVPLIEECHACFECRLHDDAMVDRYNLFVFEVVKAHMAPVPRHPRTLHYTGDGVFMTAGKAISRRSKFRPELLD
ncbi:flavin reductase family protein [Marinibaculum pumilum]|uniref:Flavin reductase family protein n=1 Tax=Marinibaculum pumilum TaxID=1766165 RepID=A0ABV7KYI0_9PROT